MPARRSSSESKASLKQKLDDLIDEMIERGIAFPDAMREFEHRFLTQMMERENGNLSRAAKVLKIHRNTLSKKLHDAVSSQSRRRGGGRRSASGRSR